MARARSFGSIRKLPSGKYQARYWHLGKQIAGEHTYANKTDARRWLPTIEADMVRGDWVDPDDSARAADSRMIGSPAIGRKFGEDLSPPVRDVKNSKTERPRRHLPQDASNHSWEPIRDLKR